MRRALGYSSRKKRHLDDRELARFSEACEQIECAELHEILADYKHCVEGVKKKKAGMFVENDT